MSDILKELDKDVKKAKKAAEKLLIQTVVVTTAKKKRKSTKTKYKNQISTKKDDIKEELDIIINQLESSGKGKWAKSAKSHLEKAEKKLDSK
ncbi:hypothetical protein ACWCL1_01870 [Ligilactobacillus sp. LYQ135]